MRIIGGHDYYDGAVPYGAEKDRVFLRDRRDLKLPADNKHRFRFAALNGWECRLLDVIFCGTRYRGVEMSKYVAKLPGVDRHYFWSGDKLRGFFAARKVKMGSRAKWGRLRWRANDHDVFAEDVDGYFKPEAVPKSLFDTLLAERVMVAILPSRGNDSESREEWKVNSDGLKDIGFASAVPPWAAYQELDMFLGTILVGDEDRMVRVSDKTKLRKYGFDEWSFKNDKHRAKPRGRTAPLSGASNGG